MDKVLHIPKSDSKYAYILKALSFIPPFSNLTPSERTILSELLRYNEELSYLDISKREKLVFDYDTVIEMCEKFDIDRQKVYNNMTSLKQKGLLVKNEGKKGSRTSFEPSCLLENIDSLTFKFTK